MTGYECCCHYRAIKFHFTSNYDYTKYNGKIKYTKAQYAKNSHKFVYEKIGKKFSDNTAEFFLANFIEREIVWVQELYSQESFDIYSQYIKRIQSLSYIFKNEVSDIFDSEENVFKSDNGNSPLLLTKLLRKEISLETLVIINDFTKFIPKWDKSIEDEFIWPNIKSKLINYKPFVNYDREKFKNILKDAIG